MKKDLPNVFANKIDNNINNVQNVYHGSDRNYNIDEILNKLSDSSRYIFNTSLEIITKSGKSIEKLALRGKDYLLTLNNQKIYLKDILGIKEVK